MGRSDLLDSSRQCFPRILGLSRRQANQLSASESERSSHKCTAEAFEAVMKGARRVPEAEAHVASVRDAVIVAAHDVD